MLNDVDVIIFDSDGVLVEDGTAISGASEVTKEIINLGKKVIVFSNNSTTHPYEMAKHYTKLGIEFTDIMSSAMLVTEYLNAENIEKVFVVGESGFIDLLAENGITCTNENAQAVIVGMDRTLTYEKLAIATRLLRSGARFICSNPDKSFPTARGQEPGAGSMIAALIASSDKMPEITIGKPNPYGYLQIIKKLNVEKSRVIMIGDRFETDIIGAIEAGIKGIIVNTGIASSRNRPGSWNGYPDVTVISSLNELLKS